MMWNVGFGWIKTLCFGWLKKFARLVSLVCKESCRNMLGLCHLFCALRTFLDFSFYWVKRVTSVFMSSQRVVRKRVCSEGAIFQHSWDYTRRVGLTLIEEVMSKKDIPPQEVLRVCQIISKKPLSPSGRSLSAISPPNSLPYTPEMPPVTYHKSQDGRNVLDFASISQIVFSFVDEQWIPPGLFLYYFCFFPVFLVLPFFFFSFFLLIFFKKTRQKWKWYCSFFPFFSEKNRKQELFSKKKQKKIKKIK